MKRGVISWYNSLRETWGLELIGDEPEDIAGLALEDFRFRAGTVQDHDNAEKLHRACLDEYVEWCIAQKMTANVVIDMDEWVFPGDVCAVAETAGGEFAGYISAVRSGATLRICGVEVHAEYRGLGLGKALTSRLLEQADAVPAIPGEQIHHIIIDIPSGTGMEHFTRVLLREGFNPCVQRFYREIKN
jgi:ribosomal protein S18 acetylase RimI-like enzyme